MGGIAAFTQEVGNHTKYEHRYSYGWGQWFGWHGRELIGDNIVSVAESRKPSPTQSDHVRGTNYYRSARNMRSDVPVIERRYQTEGNPPDDYVVIDYSWDHYISTEHGVGSWTCPDPAFWNAYDESVVKALNGLGDHYVNIGADLGQARQTINMFSSSVSRMAKSLLALKRGNFKEAFYALPGYRGKALNLPDLQKTIADLWLEYSYGWKPLMQDVYEGQQLVHQALQKPVPIRSSATAKSSNQVEFLWENKYLHRGATESSFKTRLAAHLENPDLYYLNQAGLTNPAAIAWELVPWSFAVDWFVPVGATLQACTAACGLGNDGSETTVHTYDTAELSGYPESYGRRVEQQGHYQDYGFGFQRWVHAEFPQPHFYADVTPYSTSRALNALALVRQLA